MYAIRSYYEKINQELEKFSEKLSGKKQIVLANKMDLLYDMEKYEEFKAYLEEKGIEVYPVSVILGEGLNEVLYKTYEMLGAIEREDLEEESDINEVIKQREGDRENFV